MAEAVRTREPELSPGGRSEAARDGWAGWLTGRRVLHVALGLIGIQLLVRGWVAASGFFWQDDLIVTGLAGQGSVFSADFLLYDHDGHFMPAGFLLTGLLTRLAPLEWWPMVVALVLMQALASLAVLRALRLLLGNRPGLLAPLLVYLFSPLTLSAFAWWIAAVNALPLQAGMAWVVGDAIKLLRTGRIRHAVTGTLAFAASVSFFEKSLVVPVVAFAVMVLLLRGAGDRTPLVSAARRGRWLWGGLVLVVGVWAWVYTSVVGSPAVDAEYAGRVPQAANLVGKGLFDGLLPAVLGGPITWADGLYAAPPTVLVVISVLCLVGAIVWTSRHRSGTGVIWWMVAAYVAVGSAAILVGRLNEATPDILALSLRYFADSTVVIALALAFLLLAPVRRDFPRREVLTAQGRRVAVAVVAAAFVVTSLWSTVTFTQMWRESPTADYLRTAKASLAETDVPLLDQGVPNTVLWALVHPYNLTSHVFSPWAGPAAFATSTPELQLLDESGRLVDAGIDPLRSLRPGPLENCGHGVRAGRTTSIPLDGPLVALPWTVQLNYLAGADGFLDISLDGEWIRTPVVEGPNTVFVRVVGGGDRLRVKSVTDGLAVCVDSGRIGFVEPGR